MSDQSARLYSMFVEDGTRMLAEVRDVLNSDVGLSAASLVRVRRAAHSLKSEASFLGFEGFAAIAHQLESELEGFAPGAIRHHDDGSAKLVDRDELLRLTAGLEDSYRAIVAGDTNDYQASRHVLSESAAEDDILALDKLERRMVQEAWRRNERLYLVELDVREMSEMLYPRLFLLITKLERHVTLIRTVPNRNKLESSRFSFLQALCSSDEDLPYIEEAVDVDGVSSPRIIELDYSEVLETDSGHSAYEGALSEGLQKLRVPMPTREYERLGLCAEELAHRVVRSGAEASTVSLAKAIERSVSGSSRSSIREVFSDIMEPVHRLADRLGKKVHFVVSGGRARVYVPVAAVVTDALLHIVKNAVDHGLEAPDERTRLGKPEAGTIRLSSQLEDGMIVVRVEDDGRGIDEQMVRSQAEGLGDSAPLLDALIMPGVSTKEEVDSDSGRGIGLDIAHHSIVDLLGGNLQVKTSRGDGTAFTLSFPSSRIVSVLVCKIMSGYIAVPNAIVVDVRRFSASLASEDASGNLLYSYEGRHVTLLYADALPGTIRAYTSVLILGMNGRHMAVPIVELVSEESVVREGAHRAEVYSQNLGQEVSFYFPVDQLAEDM